jgi:hypothetical protein
VGEVTPSPPKGAGIAGAVAGGIIGLVVAVFLSIAGYSMSGFAWDGSGSPTRGACGSGIVAGIVLLAAAAAIGWIAWYMLFRNSSRTFGAGFLRGLSLIVAAYLLIPWPCSYTWAAFTSFGVCAR